MACEFAVLLPVGRYPQGAEAALAALDLVEALEDQLTIYRPTSEVSRLNALAADHAVEIEPRLYDLLAEAVEMSRQTGGAYDVTSGPLSELWGFHRRQGAVPDPNDLAATLTRVGSDKLHLDPLVRSARFSVPGMSINLGSIGKGYALDRLAEQLTGQGLEDYLLHAGQSSVLARGRESSAEPGWRIGVPDPLAPEQSLGQLVLGDRALSTSGSAAQFFVHEGRRLGHILDPRTGWPADQLLSATVLAPTAAQAEALSTALFVLGAAAAAEFSALRPDVAAILVLPGQSGSPRQMVPLNLPSDVWIPSGATS
jgi:thiamine biosynthesis lipoprotein